MQKLRLEMQSYSLKAKSFKFFLAVLPFCFLLLTFYGCTTVPLKTILPAYNINGASYYPLIPFCESKGISWQYDTFTRVINLNNGTHKVILKAGDNLILVDGKATYLSHPVDIYEGTIVVPLRFKDQVLDTLFKEVRVMSEKKADFRVALKIKKVIVDAGHGGNDPGAIGKTGLREKDVNLDIAKRLATILRSEGVDVVMTRNTDRFIPLGTRVKISNNANADIFVSVHSNANRVRSLNGFEVYYVATSVSDTKRAIQAAQSANFNLDNASIADSSSDLRTILWDLLYTYDRAESIELARNICKAVGNNLDVRVIGVKDARYEVLRGAQMPAVLVETGFVSNYNEEKMLKNGYYRQKIAESIFSGIQNYAQGLALTEVVAR